MTMRVRSQLLWLPAIRGAIKMFWLRFRGAGIIPIFMQTNRLLRSNRDPFNSLFLRFDEFVVLYGHLAAQSLPGVSCWTVSVDDVGSWKRGSREEKRLIVVDVQLFIFLWHTLWYIKQFLNSSMNSCTSVHIPASYSVYISDDVNNYISSYWQMSDTESHLLPETNELSM